MADAIGIVDFPAVQLYRNGTTYLAPKSLNDVHGIATLLASLMPIYTKVQFPKDAAQLKNMVIGSEMAVVLFHVPLIPDKPTVLDKFDALSIKYPEVRFIAIDGQHQSFLVSRFNSGYM